MVAATTSPRCAVILLVSLLITIPERARAGNDDGIPVGNDALLTGGAVVATGGDGGMLYYNPAGLARARHLNTLDASGSAFVLRRYSVPRLLAATNGEGGDGSFGEFIAVPNTVTYVRQISDSTTFGAGMFIPEARDIILRSSMVVSGAVDSRWQVALAEEFSRYNFGAGLAFTLSPNIMLGFTVFATYIKQMQSLHVAGGFQANENIAFSSETDLTESTLIGAEAVVGLLIRPSPSVSLGLSLRTPGLQGYLSSRSTSSSAAAAVIEDGDSTASLVLPDTDDSSFDANIYAPLRARIGVGWYIGDAVIALGADIQPEAKNSGIDLDRVTTWNARLGGTFDVTNRITLAAGVFTDNDPVRATGGYEPTHFYGVNLGARFLMVHVLAPNGQADELTLSSTFGLRFAHGEGKIEGVHIDDELNVTEEGVDQTINEITLNVASSVGF